MPANQLQKLNSTELYSLLFSSYLLTVMVFTAQHYASMGLYNSDTSYGTICHKSVLSKWLNGSSLFLAWKAKHLSCVTRKFGHHQ